MTPLTPFEKDFENFDIRHLPVLVDPLTLLTHVLHTHFKVAVKNAVKKMAGSLPFEKPLDTLDTKIG